MKADKVLKLLKISRVTLCNYAKTGKIKATKLPSGHYDYDIDSVYELIGKRNKTKRVNVLYCRVSTPKQKKDLENQKKTLEEFCAKNGLTISNIYEDVGSGINFDRKGLSELILKVINHEVSKVIITYKDRLSRISFDLFKNLFEEFNCEIVVLNEIDDPKTVEKEIFKEIVDMIHCFSMRLSSSRRKEKLKLVEKQLKLDEEDDK